MRILQKWCFDIRFEYGDDVELSKKHENVANIDKRGWGEEVTPVAFYFCSTLPMPYRGQIEFIHTLTFLAILIL